MLAFRCFVYLQIAFSSISMFQIDYFRMGDARVVFRSFLRLFRLKEMFSVIVVAILFVQELEHRFFILVMGNEGILVTKTPLR